MTNEDEPMRLQKRLAQLGVASRRASEKLITAGRVTVNGTVVRELGTKVRENDAIGVDGARVNRSAPIVVALNKPRGCIVAHSDPQGRHTVYELLPKDLPFLGHVGRLDFNTEGILLFTNDGDLSQALLSPASEVPRVYVARFRGRITPRSRAKLEAGVPLDGRPTQPLTVETVPSKGKHDWLRLTLTEGKNRHIHRVLEAVGHSVSRLVRVSFAGVTDEDLPEGAYRLLSPAAIRQLRERVGLD